MMKRRTAWLRSLPWLASSVLVACGSSDAEQDRAVTPAAAGPVELGADEPPVADGDVASDEGSAPAPSAAPRAASGASGSPSIAAGAADPASGADAAGESASAPASGDDAAPVVPTTSAPPLRPLTAGTWDDNRNFERFLAYRSELLAQQLAGLPAFDESAQRAAAERSAQLASHATLDIALVIDTTASMTDELSYLQSEFLDLSSAIEAEYPQAEQRWALIVYRDDGDEYSVRSFDFEATAGAFRERIEAQRADGGGDYPEAADEALEAMNQLAWRADAGAARLAFWVADAPHHVEKTAQVTTAVEGAAEQDIHIYPVASSGVDERTEYSMRAAAQLTLGRYLFLTDDSGVGGSHKEPSIPCYFVTRLDAAILRMVDIEMSGSYREPDAADVIRSSGDPANGTCSLDGETLFAF